MLTGTVGRVRTCFVAGSAVLSMAACGGDTASPERLEPIRAAAVAAAPETLVLRAQELRSWPAPWELGVLPAFSLYGGGRVIVPGSSAGALQQAREFRLPVPEFEQLVVNAGAAGLDQANTYEDTDTVDASLLLVSLRTADGVRVTRQTRWSSGDDLYVVSFRPLRPDERTCGDLDIR